MRGREIKRPACAGLKLKLGGFGLTECLDMSGQAALVACHFVLMNEATGAGAVHNRFAQFQRRYSCGFVFSFNRFHDFLNRRAQHRASTGIALTTLDRLTRALFCRFDISQGKAPGTNGRKNKPAIIASAGLFVNEGRMSRLSEGCA